MLDPVSFLNFFSSNPLFYQSLMVLFQHCFTEDVYAGVGIHVLELFSSVLTFMTPPLQLYCIKRRSPVQRKMKHRLTITDQLCFKNII